MTGVKFFGFALGSFLVTWFILPSIKEMLVEAGFVRPNFRKESIPLGVGLVFYLSALVVIAAGAIGGLVYKDAYSFLFAVGGMGLFGLIDDVFGTRGASGLKGHFKKLFIQREITTGALKALAGGVIALVVSLGNAGGGGFERWLLVVMNTLIMALATNAVNLLDLRPGRAGKGFMLISVFIIAAGFGKAPLWYLATMAGSLAAFLPLDLKAHAMMGDTGSNMLGMTLGYTAVFVLDLPERIGFLVFLVGFHLLTEKYSLTRIIEGNKVLNYIDMIGRDKKVE